MRYNLGVGVDKNWTMTEEVFIQELLGKCEAVMSLGNGYMGIRSATEESYVGEVRNTFVAGIFNKFVDGEVTELANIADVIGMVIRINGERLDLITGKVIDYNRTINARTGELTRNFIWESTNNGRIQFHFKRFVSRDNLHLIGQEVEIIPLDQDVNIQIESGINGQMTNSGSQHFKEKSKRMYDHNFLQYVQSTIQTKIDLVLNSVHELTVNNLVAETKEIIRMKRRKIYKEIKINLKKDENLVIHKLSNIYTSRDRDYSCDSLVELQKYALNKLKDAIKLGYTELFENSVNAWKNKVWNIAPIQINSTNEYDQFAIRFAQYHLEIMTPSHDNRMNIGAKGLSGEGYKGHTFWDTEIFILPYFVYSFPEVARSLLEYRYLSLVSARQKAHDNNCEGAMFPWESAWLDDGEVTPEWGDADIITGEPTKISSGFVEIHITADIVYALWQYYQITGDEDFMNRYGYEIIFDTAKFWASRLEWDASTEKYSINNIIGPDEYKENISSNAFTNHMAHFNMMLAMDCYERIEEGSKELFNRLDLELNLKNAHTDWLNKTDKIYLPQPNNEDIIPQDATYLSKQIIDLKIYKEQEHVGGIFDDYNLHQINEIQVTKQADIMALFYCLEDRFSRETKLKNWNYYEPKTLHDSSLSLTLHSVLAADLNKLDMAYDMFQRTARIDFGPNMKSSDEGIHSASIGGIWQCVTFGFGGVRMYDGKLRIEPKIPKEWSEFSFIINWRGDQLQVEVNQERFIITNLTGRNKDILFLHKGEEINIKERVEIKF